MKSFEITIYNISKIDNEKNEYLVNRSFYSSKEFEDIEIIIFYEIETEYILFKKHTLYEKFEILDVNNKSIFRKYNVLNYKEYIKDLFVKQFQYKNIYKI